MKYKEHLTQKFIRSTFIGFVLGLIVMYLKPELQNSIVFMYTVLGGKNAVEAFKANKELPKQE